MNNLYDSVFDVCAPAIMILATVALVTCIGILFSKIGDPTPTKAPEKHRVEIVLEIKGDGAACKEVE